MQELAGDRMVLVVGEQRGEGVATFHMELHDGVPPVLTPENVHQVLGGHGKRRCRQVLAVRDGRNVTRRAQAARVAFAAIGPAGCDDFDLLHDAYCLP